VQAVRDDGRHCRAYQQYTGKLNMKISLIALAAGCVVASSAFALTDSVPTLPPRALLADSVPTLPPRALLADSVPTLPPRALLTDSVPTLPPRAI